jgi:hypothetical protein
MSAELMNLEDPAAKKFGELLLASGLVTHTTLDDFIRNFCAAYPDKSLRLVDNFTLFLVQRKVITEWQARQLREGRFKGFFIDHYILAKHVRNEMVKPNEWYATYMAFDTESNHHVLLRFLRKLGEPSHPNSYEIIED